MPLNNKGQTLVMFVLIIPIILLILVLIYDIGNALYEKNRLSNTSYLSIEYALDNINNIDENDIIKYIMNDNNNLSKISVIIKDNTIDIELEKEIKGIFSKNVNLDITTVKTKYRGKIKNNKKNIERIKW